MGTGKAVVCREQPSHRVLGGRREGAGRPRAEFKVPKVTIAVRLPEWMVLKIKSHGMTLSDGVREALAEKFGLERIDDKTIQEVT